MGIPTSIPSGGDGLDRISEPLPAADLQSELPKIEDDPEFSEFEEFQRWKRARQSTAERPTPARAPRKKPSLQKRPLPVPVDEGAGVEQDRTGPPSTWGLKRKVDGKTGKTYFEIPKTKMGDDGRPQLAIDLNIDDLNGEANSFLAHLRVPPSPEEREAILRKKSELAKKQRADREALNAQLDEKEGSLEEPDEDPFNENPTKRRGLFGRKS